MMSRGLKSAVVCFAAMLLATLAGCAYSTRNALPPHLKTIAIPVFKNKTFVTDYSRKIEVDVTEATRQAFLQNGELTVVGRESADLILEGEVARVERDVLRSDRFGEAAEIRLVITARISLYDVKEAKYILSHALVSNTVKKNESGVYNIRRGEFESAGKQNAIDEIGKVIAHAITERWPATKQP